jgi:uncharacterized cupin superfamily protein
MPVRKLNVRDVKPFDYSFGDPISARMADIGRALGSASIGLTVQTVAPGHWSSRRHRHLFQEEILLVRSGSGTLHHGTERVSVEPGDCVCYLPGDPEPHSFENTGRDELVIWAFGNRFRHEICVYPDQGVAERGEAVHASLVSVPRHFAMRCDRSHGVTIATCGIGHFRRACSAAQPPNVDRSERSIVLRATYGRSKLRGGASPGRRLCALHDAVTVHISRS